MPSAFFLTQTPPLPLVSGERIRNFHLLRALREHGWGVSLAALDPGGRLREGDRDRLAGLCDELHVHPLPASNRMRTAGSVLSLLLGRPVFERFFYDKDAHSSLQARLRCGDPHDLIVIEGLYMSVYVPDDLRRRALFDAHNVELRRLESMASAVGLSPRGVAARVQHRPLREYEASVAASVGAVTCVSEPDASYFRPLAPGRVHVVRNGVDCDALQPRPALPDGASALYVGSMDYSANVDAVGWLAREILPLLTRRAASVTVIGSNPRREVFAHAERSPVPLRILGYVEDTAESFERSRVFVAPLRFGGGTRLKILEALARGVPVVTTSLGCEGLDLAHERELIVADRPEEFARWLDRLFVDDELCLRLAAEGRKAVEERYDWSRIGSRFDAAARELVGERQYA
jgi:glycosyltransferase involved in cell wall biosynthesis